MQADGKRHDFAGLSARRECRPKFGLFARNQEALRTRLFFFEQAVKPLILLGKMPFGNTLATGGGVFKSRAQFCASR